MESKRSPASLLDYLELKHSKFIILVNGKNCYGKLFQRSQQPQIGTRERRKNINFTITGIRNGKQKVC